MLCTLCGGSVEPYVNTGKKKYMRCTLCGSVLLLPDFFLDAAEEKGHYLNHNNDVTDVRYQQFVYPITCEVKKTLPPTSLGLDYGCGTGPVAAAELQKLGFSVSLYDPFFENHPEALKQTYDFIICSEVMEHFHEPYREFNKLYALLNPRATLYCKTEVLTDDINFEDWYYRLDPTHVFFYTPESLHWIKEHLGFSTLEIRSKLIIFGK